jgi:anthranilate synthase component 1
MTTPLAPGQIRVLTRRVDGAPDPLLLFRRLADPKHALLLESAETSAQSGRVSFIVPSAAARVEGRGREVRVERLREEGRGVLDWLRAAPRTAPHLVEASEHALTFRFAPPPPGLEAEARLLAPSPLDVLRALTLDARPVDQSAPGAVFLGGLFGFDLLDAFEDLPPPASDPLSVPDLAFLVPSALIRIDHREGQTRVSVPIFGAAEPAASARALSLAAERISNLSGAIEASVELSRQSTPPAPAPDVTAPEQVAVDLDDARFEALVETLKAHIHAGDVFQIVASRTFSAPCDDPLGAYARLRALNPSPYMFFMREARFTLFGASPETALKVNAPRGDELPQLEVKPIAGTRPRGKRPDGTLDLDLDGRLEAELRLHEKEVAEHMMLVDLARNDVARVSAPGTRHVARLLDVERYSHVMHLVSRVRGGLRPGLDALHAYQATLNMGTLTGAPKLKACQLLRGYETSRRGAYGGAVGYLTDEGALDTCIVIRSALVAEGRAHVRAGAGVVLDSDPQGEADETRRKAAAVLAALSGGRG